MDNVHVQSDLKILIRMETKLFALIYIKPSRNATK